MCFKNRIPWNKALLKLFFYVWFFFFLKMQANIYSKQKSYSRLTVHCKYFLTCLRVLFSQSNFWSSRGVIGSSRSHFQLNDISYHTWLLYKLIDISFNSADLCFGSWREYIHVYTPPGAMHTMYLLQFCTTTITVITISLHITTSIDITTFV